MDASRLEQREAVSDGFRRLRPEDREPLLAIAAQVWEGHDYLPHIFDAWVADRNAYFAGMFVAGELVGCGRLLPLDERRAWLEALRVDPARHGQGLGRRMSAHIAGAALERGFRELLFATYFDNQASIRISEAAGFRRIATFTHLFAEDLEQGAGAPAKDADEGAMAKGDPPGVTERPGVPEAEDYLVNDWFFVPPGVPDRARFFPDALTLTHGESRILIARNEKYPGCLEICWRQAPEGRLAVACLAAARDHARRRACTSMHTMLPEGHALDPYREVGFAYFEQEKDTYLYAARAEDLRL